MRGHAWVASHIVSPVLIMLNSIRTWINIIKPNDQFPQPLHFPPSESDSLALAVNGDWLRND